MFIRRLKAVLNRQVAKTPRYKRRLVSRAFFLIVKNVIYTDFLKVLSIASWRLIGFVLNHYAKEFV